MATDDAIASSVITDIRTAAQLASAGRILSFDTETTGLAVEDGHRIVGLALVEIVHLKRTGRELRLRMNPQRLIDPEAIAVHGITDEEAAAAPLFEELVPQLEAFMAGAPLLAHNAPFDLGFLESEYQHIGQTISFTGIDTVPIARARWPGRHADLNSVSHRLGVDLSGRTNAGGLHDELVDARILADVFISLCQERLGDLFAVQADAEAVSKQATEGENQAGPAGTTYASRVPPPHPPLSAAEVGAFQGTMARIGKAAKGGSALWSTHLKPADQ